MVVRGEGFGSLVRKVKGLRSENWEDTDFHFLLALEKHVHLILMIFVSSTFSNFGMELFKIPHITIALFFTDNFCWALILKIPHPPAHDMPVTSVPPLRFAPAAAELQGH